MNDKSKKLSLFCVLSLVGMLCSPVVFAHKISVFAYVEDNNIFVDGYFADGKKAMKSKVIVHGADDAVVYEGVTNEEGTLAFPLPVTDSSLRVVINAGMGHQGQYIIPADEVTGVIEVMEDAVTDVDNVDDVVQLPVNHGQLELMVKQAVSEAIKPLVRELAASQEHTSFSQMVGAIGYIFGFMGLLAYLTARKKDKESKEK